MNKELTPLEALQEIKEQMIYYKQYAKEKLPTKVLQIDKDGEEELDIVENALKALEIIKPCCIVADYKTDDPDTRYELAFCKKICIAQEEYDLLKEVLL